jgi:hypothetical protein
VDSGSGVIVSVRPPQSEDLNAPQLSVIRATPYNSCHEGNAHAYKTKLESEKSGSDAGIEVRWEESCKNKKAESARQESSRHEETTGCCRRSTTRRSWSTGCRSRSAACRSRSAGHHNGLNEIGTLSAAYCHLLCNCLAARYRIVGLRSLNEHRHRPLSAELALGALEPDVLLDDFETVARQLISVADREIGVDLSTLCC